MTQNRWWTTALALLLALSGTAVWAQEKPCCAKTSACCTEQTKASPACCAEKCCGTAAVAACPEQDCCAETPCCAEVAGKNKQQIMFRVLVAEIHPEVAPLLGVKQVKPACDDPQAGIVTLLDKWDAGRAVAAIQTLGKVKLASVLSRPCLVTVSGQTASFSCGSKVPVNNGAGVLHLVPVGVEMQLHPAISDSGRIRMQLKASVSEVGNSGDCRETTGAVPVPSLSTQNTETSVEMGEGQTMVLHGLISKGKAADSAREKVFFVTPEFVRPAVPVAPPQPAMVPTKPLPVPPPAPVCPAEVKCEVKETVSSCQEKVCASDTPCRADVAGKNEQQIMLQVMVAEIHPETVPLFGFEQAKADGGTSPAAPWLLLGKPDAGRVVTALQALRRLKLAKVLAQPHLVTISGRPASFRCGGEIPVPKEAEPIRLVPLGTEMHFAPAILESGRIQLELKALFSDLNWDRKVGGAIPINRLRRIDTTVEMSEGQTMVLRSMALSDEAEDGMRERIILVTPQFVRPAIPVTPPKPVMVQTKPLPVPPPAPVCPADVECEVKEPVKTVKSVTILRKLKKHGEVKTNCSTAACGAVTCQITGTTPVIKAAAGPIKVVTNGKQVQVATPFVEATADRLSSTELTNQIVLEGHVRLKYQKGDTRAEVIADRAVLHLEEGRIEVSGMKIAD